MVAFSLSKLLSKFKAFKSKSKVVSKTLNVFDDKVFVDMNDDARINLKMTQWIFTAFLISGSINVFFIALFIVLMPLKEKVPTFVHFLPREEQIVVVEPFKTNKTFAKRMQEFLARDYIKKRETIDLKTETDRYGSVCFQSVTEVCHAFNDQYNADTNANSPYKLAVDKEQLRTIAIINSVALSGTSIQVEFEAIVSQKSTGKILQTDIIVAIVSFEIDETYYKNNDYLKNPYGFLVNDYSLGVKEHKANYEDKEKKGEPKNADKKKNKKSNSSF